MVSESNDPEEWQYIGWVVRNRVEAKGRFRDTYQAVIRQPMQFSYWNKFSHLGDVDAYAAAKADGSRIAPQLAKAEEYAKWVLATPREYAPFGPTVYYFWSPISMSPEGRLPTWAKKLKRFTPAGIDPWRFIFAHEAS